MKLDSIHSGFAAGCEAGLGPAVAAILTSGGSAPGSGFAPPIWTRGRTKGIAPSIKERYGEA